MGNRIKVNHYVDLLMFSIEQVIRGMKSDMNQYINSLNLGITAEQFLVLDTIDSGNNICQQDVADLLGKDKSNIKRIVEILEQKELITRVAGKKNNRLVNYLVITDNGKRLIKENIDKVKKFMEKVFSVISEDEELYLKQNDKVLILESCTHHAIDDDIARVKIPKLIEKKLGYRPNFEYKTGHDFPDISEYKLIIHCGACMTNRKEVLSRILIANKNNIPITNYGIAISCCLDILERATDVFS